MLKEASEICLEATSICLDEMMLGLTDIFGFSNLSNFEFQSRLIAIVARNRLVFTFSQAREDLIPQVVADLVTRFGVFCQGDSFSQLWKV